MKKLILMGLLASTLCATAQTTGSLYPQNKSVFNHKEYGETIRVSYDNLVKASDVPMVVKPAATETTLTNIKVELFNINLGKEIKDEYIANYSLTTLPIETEKARRINETASISFNYTADNFNVYNIKGEIVKSNATLSELSCLPKGIYIVNGKKITVR